MRTPNTPELRRLIMAKAQRTRLFGPGDPRTVAAARELIRYRIEAAEAAVCELRRELAELPDTGAAA